MGKQWKKQAENNIFSTVFEWAYEINSPIFNKYIFQRIYKQCELATHTHTYNGQYFLRITLNKSVLKSNMKSTVSVLRHNLCLLNCVVWRSRADNILPSFALNSLWNTTPLLPSFSCLCHTFNKIFLFAFMRQFYSMLSYLSIPSLAVFTVLNCFNMEIITITFFHVQFVFRFFIVSQFFCAFDSERVLW